MAAIVIVATILGLFVSLLTTAWGSRTSQWMRDLARSGVAYKGARFSDFVGFAGFGLTIVTIGLSWFTVSLQNRKAVVDSQIKDTTNHISTITAEISRMEQTKKRSFAPGVDIHLEEPVRGSHLIGRQIDFVWNYTGHSKTLNYRIELVKLGSSRPPAPQEVECDFEKYSSCQFYATQPQEQRSRLTLLIRDGDVASDWEGAFLWRIVPAKPPSRIQIGVRGDADIDISDWSEFASFDIYSSLQRRMLASEPAAVLVGTTYSDNIAFSHLTEDGSQAGYDIDLIRLLIEGCLSKDIADGRKNLVFDPTQCYRAVADYEDQSDSEKTFTPRKRANQPRAVIIAYPSVGDGLAALTRKQVDVFIGSLTSAIQRETGGILFTDGYYRFDTSLYSHRYTSSLAGSPERYREWMDEKRSIGVIENSTNQWLATFMAADPAVGQQLSIIGFPSYGTMASAFERRAVDGVLMDNVLGCDLQKAEVPGSIVPIGGLEDTSAWTQYHERLGAEHEHFAIAVATDFVPMRGSNLDQREDKIDQEIKDWMNQKGTPIDVGGIYQQLQAALAMVRTDRLKRRLEKRNNVPEEGHADQACLSKTIH